MLKLIHQSGGTLTGSQRAMADKLGVTQPTLNRVLGEAKAAGLIAMQSDRLAGTSVALIMA